MLERNWLKKVNILKEMSDKDRSILKLYIQEETFEEKEIIYEEGQNGGKLFFVQEGKLRVFRKGAKFQEFELGTIEPGSVFGAITFFDGGKHTASVAVVKKTAVGVLSIQKFKMMAKKHPALAFMVTKGLLLELQKILRKMNAKYVSMMEFIQVLGK
ncbi:MAG TPA: cyclic nucleotide-binding domain-containing protein [Nitrospiria bacterium]